MDPETRDWIRCREWLKAYGGTYNDYLDTPEAAIEMLLRLDQVMAPQRATPTPAPALPGVPIIR